MTPINKLLVGALVLQLGLAAVTWMPTSSGPSSVTLVDFGADAITHLEIVPRTTPEMESPPRSIVLDKEGDTWLISSASDYPADPDRVQPVLDQLGEVVVHSPIGTTAGAHAALQVADDQFTRRVTVSAGPESKTLFLGAATGASMQVRPEGEAEVYQLRGVTAWSIPDTPRRFFDTAYVKVPVDSITDLRIKNPQGDHTLIRMGGAWSSEELEDPSNLQQGEADAIARSLLSLRMSGPAGREVKPEYGLDGSVRVEFTVIEGESTVLRGYTVGARASEAKRYVKADDSEWVVEVLESAVIRALETDFKFLEVALPTEEDNQPAGGFFGAAPPG